MMILTMSRNGEIIVFMDVFTCCLIRLDHDHIHSGVSVMF